MMITLVSVLVALVIGGIEALSVVAGQLKLSSGPWDGIGSLSGHFETLGFIIVGVFMVSWAVPAIVYGIKRYDDLDVPIAQQAKTM